MKNDSYQTPKKSLNKIISQVNLIHNINNNFI